MLGFFIRKQKHLKSLLSKRFQMFLSVLFFSENSRYNFPDEIKRKEKIMFTLIFGAICSGASLGATIGGAIATLTGTAVGTGAAIGTVTGAAAGAVAGCAEAANMAEDFLY